MALPIPGAHDVSRNSTGHARVRRLGVSLFSESDGSRGTLATNCKRPEGGAATRKPRCRVRLRQPVDALLNGVSTDGSSDHVASDLTTSNPAWERDACGGIVSCSAWCVI